MLTLMPRITVVTARRVFGEPWAHIRRSVPVYANCQHFYTCGDKGKARETYRHDLPPLANNALLRADINNSTVQAPTRLLNQPSDQEHPRLSSNPLKLLPRTITAQRRRSPVTTADIHSLEPAGDPVVPGTRALAHDVAEVDGLLKVAQVLVAALGAAAADDAPEGRPPRVPAQVGLGQEEDVGGVVAGCAAGDLAQLGESGCCCGLGGGGACRQADLAWGWG